MLHPDGITMVEREKTISILQACELVSVSRRTIYNWLAAGKLKYLRTAGGSIRIFPSSLFQAGNVAANVVEEGPRA